MARPRRTTTDADEGATTLRALEAAEEVFAERGFAAARIDEIAARARMAKSHLYYHFDGKQALLDRLVALRIEEMLAAKERLLAGTTSLGPEEIARFVEGAVRTVLLPRERFLRIVLLESLGSSEAEPLFLRVVGPLLEDAVLRLEALGYHVDREQFVSDAFHFGIVPLVVHVVLGGRWAKRVRVRRERALGLVVSRLVQLQTQNVGRMSRRSERKKGEP